MKKIEPDSSRHVILMDAVFRWEEKAPFEPSGKSVLGALEYNKACETVRCHECGDWFAKYRRPCLDAPQDYFSGIQSAPRAALWLIPGVPTVATTIS